MAVIPSKYEISSAYLEQMKRNRLLLLKIIQIMEFSNSFGIYWDHSYSRYGMIETSHDSYQSMVYDGEINGGEPEIPDKKKKVNQWPDPISLLRCPGQISVDIDEDARRFAQEDAPNFSFSYQFPQNQPKPENPGGESSEESLPVQSISPSNQNTNESTIIESSQPPRPESACSSNTDTASNASSTYNHHFADDNDPGGDSDGADSSGDPPAKKRRYLPDQNCPKFFICKYEVRSKLNQSSDEINDEQQSTVQSQSTEVVQTSGNESELVGEIASTATTSVQPTINNEIKMEVDQEVEQKPQVIATTSQVTENIPPSDDIIKLEEDKNVTTSISALYNSLLGQLRSFKERQFNYHEFEQHLKPHILKDLIGVMTFLNLEISRWQRTLREEQKNKQKAQLDDSRRVHDYDHFITTFLSMFFEQGLLDQVIDKELYQPLSERNNGNVPAEHHREGSSRVNGSSNSFGSVPSTVTSVGNTSATIVNGGMVPLANLSNIDELKANAESLKLDYENSLFFPANMAMSSNDPAILQAFGENSLDNEDTEN